MMMQNEPSHGGMTTPDFGSGASDDDQEEVLDPSKSLYTESEDSTSYPTSQSLGELVRKYAQISLRSRSSLSKGKSKNKYPAESSGSKKTNSVSNENASSKKSHLKSNKASDSSIKKKAQNELASSDTKPSSTSNRSDSSSNQHKTDKADLGQADLPLSPDSSDSESTKKMDHNSFINTLLLTKKSLRPQGSFLKKPPPSESSSQHEYQQVSDTMNAEPSSGNSTKSSGLSQSQDYSTSEDGSLNEKTTTKTSDPSRTNMCTSSSTEKPSPFLSQPVSKQGLWKHENHVSSNTPLHKNNSLDENTNNFPGPFSSLVKKNEKETLFSNTGSVASNTRITSTMSNSVSQATAKDYNSVSKERLDSTEPISSLNQPQRRSSICKVSNGMDAENVQDMKKPVKASQFGQHQMASSPVGASIGKEVPLNAQYLLKEASSASGFARKQIIASPQSVSALMKSPVVTTVTKLNPSTQSVSCTMIKPDRISLRNKNEVPAKLQSGLSKSQSSSFEDGRGGMVYRKSTIEHPSPSLPVIPDVHGKCDLLNDTIPNLPERVIFHNANYTPIEVEVLDKFKRILGYKNSPPDDLLLRLIWYHQEETYADALSHYTELSGWLSQHHANAVKVYQENAAPGLIYCYGRSLWGHPVVVCRVANFLKIKQSNHILTTVHLLDVVKSRLLVPGNAEQIVFLVDMRDCVLLRRALIVYLRGISRLFCGLVAAWFFINCDVATYISFVDYEIVENTLRSKFHYITTSMIGSYICLDRLETLYGGFAKNATQFDCLYTTENETQQTRGRYKTIDPIGPTIPSEPYILVNSPSKSIPVLSLSDMKAIQRFIQQIVNILHQEAIFDSSFHSYVTQRYVFSAPRDHQELLSSQVNSSKIDVNAAMKLQLYPAELELLARAKKAMLDTTNVVHHAKLDQFLKSMKPADVDILLLRLLYSANGDVFAMSRYLMEHITYDRRAKPSEMWHRARALHHAGNTHWNHPVLLFHLKSCLNFINKREDKASAIIAVQNGIKAGLDQVKQQYFKTGMVDQWFLLINLSGTNPTLFSEDQCRLDELLGYIESMFPYHTACLIFRHNSCQYSPLCRYELQHVTINSDTELNIWTPDTQKIESVLNRFQASLLSDTIPQLPDTEPCPPSNLDGSHHHTISINLTGPELSSSPGFHMSSCADSAKMQANHAVIPRVGYNVPLPYRRTPVEFLTHILHNLTLCYHGSVNKGEPSLGPSAASLKKLEHLLSSSSYFSIKDCLYSSSIPLVLHPPLQQKCIYMNLPSTTMIVEQHVSHEKQNIRLPSSCTSTASGNNSVSSGGVQIMASSPTAKISLYKKSAAAHRQGSIANASIMNCVNYTASGSISSADNMISTMNSYSSFEQDRFALKDHTAYPSAMASALPGTSLDYSYRPIYNAMQGYRNTGISPIISTANQSFGRPNPEATQYLIANRDQSSRGSYLGSSAVGSINSQYVNSLSLQSPSMSPTGSGTSITKSQQKLRVQQQQNYGSLVARQNNMVMQPNGEYVTLWGSVGPNTMSPHQASSSQIDKRRVVSRQQQLRSMSSLTDNGAIPFVTSARSSGGILAEQQAVTATMTTLKVSEKSQSPMSSNQSQQAETIGKPPSQQQDLLNEVMVLLRKSTPKNLQQEVTAEAILPFLQVALWNKSKCLKLFSDHLLWKESYVSTLSKDDLKKRIVDPSLFYVCGHDRHFRPILISRLKALNDTDYDVAQKYLIYTVDSLFRDMSRHYKNEPITVIVDAQGFTSWGVLSAASVNLIKMLQDNYPTRLNRCYVINSTQAFTFFWNLSISTHLAPATKQKVSILDGSFLKVLCKTISRSQIETRYGGKLADFQFTPHQLPVIRVITTR